MPKVNPEYRTHQPEDVLIRFSYSPEGSMAYWCPGCKHLHAVNVPGFEGAGHVWDYNGDPAKPTLSPSVLNRWEEGRETNPIPKCCHCFIRDGQIQFLSDCTHELAGQTVPMIPYDEA